MDTDLVNEITAMTEKLESLLDVKSDMYKAMKEKAMEEEKQDEDFIALINKIIKHTAEERMLMKDFAKVMTNKIIETDEAKATMDN